MIRLISIISQDTIITNKVLELGNRATPSSSKKLVLGSWPTGTILNRLVRYS
jgi:hypothetical protein